MYFYLAAQILDIQDQRVKASIFQIFLMQCNYKYNVIEKSLPLREIIWLIDWLIDFNVKSTCLGLFDV